MSSGKKLFIKTYGCQMNVYDSEQMAQALSPAGYDLTSDAAEADLILLNTCHIREKAAEKVYSELGRLKPLRKANPNLKIGVAGCVAQAEGEEIMARAPMVDLVVGPQAYHRLPDMEARARAGEKPMDIEFPEEDKFEHIPSIKTPAKRPSAFLTVQEGCDKFCAFCVVPYTRGAEVSRPAQRLIDETKALCDQGVREITLLGQNVNAYHGAGQDGDWSLAKLIHELAKIDDLKRIRYVTSHPNDMDDDLINAHADVEKLMPYLHLPVQSGSDSVLKGMNRKHTRDDYFRLIERIKKLRPDIAMSGDFIVGFPGETDADFEDTIDLVERVEYAAAYSFKYSPRPGTPASGREPVPETVMSERLARLQNLLTRQQTAFQDAQVGKVLPILLEKTGRDPGQLVGRSPYLQAVHLDASPDQIGQIVDVKIVDAVTNSLSGKLVS